MDDKKIAKLRQYFQREDERVRKAYSTHSRITHKHLSDEDLIEIRRIRGTVVSKVCDKIAEYHTLTGRRDTPIYAERFLKINARLVNLINAELAWRTYGHAQINQTDI